MAEALKKTPKMDFVAPSGVVSATIDSRTGLRLVGMGQAGMTEYFYQENMPAESAPPVSVTTDPALNPDSGGSSFPGEP